MLRQRRDRCRDFIADKSDKPFFLYYCTFDPHRRNGPADELPHKPDRFGNPRPGQRYEGVSESIFSPNDVIVPPFLPDSPECRAELAQYYQSVSRVDQGVGRLVEHLRTAGVYDTTLLIYISHTVIAMPGAKTTTYEPGIRLPCIVRVPGTPAGVVSNAMVSWVDITPTILDYAGLLDPTTSTVRNNLASMPSDPHVPRSKSVPYRFQGRSFLSTIGQQDSPGWDKVYASHSFHEVTMYYPMRVVRERRWKLIWNIAWPLEYPFASDLYESATWRGALQRGTESMYGRRTAKAFLHRPQFELYDLDSDPDEIHNLADDPAQVSRLAAMKKNLHDFQERTSDPWLLKWDHE
jgi:N-sulfoglucosamine sulfohydrolase